MASHRHFRPRRSTGLGAAVLLAVALTTALGGAAQERSTAPLHIEVDRIAQGLSDPDRRTDALAELAALADASMSVDAQSLGSGAQAFFYGLASAAVWLRDGSPAEGDDRRGKAVRDLILAHPWEGIQGVEVCHALAYNLAGRHLVANRPGPAETAAAWGLELPDRTKYTATLWRARAQAAFQLGAVARAEDSLRRLTRFAEAGGSEGELAEAQAAWARHWLDLGVLDQAGEASRTALELAERVAPAQGWSSNVLLTHVDVLLMSRRTAEAERTISGWLEPDRDSPDDRPADDRANGDRPTRGSLKPQTHLKLEVMRALAWSELERRGERAAGRSATELRRLLATDDPGGKTLWDPELRARVRLELADLAYRDGDLVGTARELEHARAVVGAHPPLSLGPLMAAYEARLLLRESPGPEQLAAARRSTSAAAEQLFAAWDSIPARPAGGIGFLWDMRRGEALSAALELCRAAAEDEDSGRVQALELLLRAQTRGNLALHFELPDTTRLAELRSDYLTPGQGVLVFLPALHDGSSHVFAFDTENLRHERLAAHHRMRPAIRAMEEGLAIHPGTLDERGRADLAAQTEQAAVALSELLLPESVRELMSEWSAVTIVGGELVGPIPFEWLPLDSGQPLGRALAVDQTASLPLALHLARTGRTEPFDYDAGLVASLTAGKWPGPASTRPASGAYRLSESELGTLVKPYPAERAWSLHNEDATWEAVLARKAALERTGVVTWLVHGGWLDEGERRAGMVLPRAEDGRVRLIGCADVERELRVPGIVVLAACETARGPERPGDDSPANLVGAFQRSGARAVLASRTVLELERTQAFLRHLMEALSNGAPAAEAARRARVNMVERGDALAALHDLAFQVHGLGQR